MSARKLPPGEHLLRLTLLTPTHMGSAEGEAILDRPTQKDASTGLPCLPESGLKGIFASRYGDASDEREALFGSPDRDDRRGRPSPLALGDGELLAFPVPARDGAVAWVFPALTVGRFLRLAPPEGEGEPSPELGLLAALEEEGMRALASPRLPELSALPRLRPLPESSARRGAPALFAQLGVWTGTAVPSGAPRLVVGSALARRLWQVAAELRVLTGLTREKTV